MHCRPSTLGRCETSAYRAYMFPLQHAQCLVRFLSGLTSRPRQQSSCCASRSASSPASSTAQVSGSLMTFIAADRPSVMLVTLQRDAGVLRHRRRHDSRCEQ